MDLKDSKGSQKDFNRFQGLLKGKKSFQRLLDILGSIAAEAPAHPQVRALRSGHDFLTEIGLEIDEGELISIQKPSKTMDFPSISIMFSSFFH